MQQPCQPIPRPSPSIPIPSPNMRDRRLTSLLCNQLKLWGGTTAGGSAAGAGTAAGGGTGGTAAGGSTAATGGAAAGGTRAKHFGRMCYTNRYRETHFVHVVISAGFRAQDATSVDAEVTEWNNQLIRFKLLTDFKRVENMGAPWINCYRLLNLWTAQYTVKKQEQERWKHNYSRSYFSPKEFFFSTKPHDTTKRT